MQIPAEKLQTHTKQALLPVYLIHGNELLLANEAAEVLLNAANKQGFPALPRQSLQSDDDWAALNMSLASQSLLAEKNALLCHVSQEKPSKKATEILKTLGKQVSHIQAAGKCLILIWPGLPNSTVKTKWFQAASAEFGVVSVRPIPLFKLPQWINQRLRQVGLTAPPKAVEYLAQATEGNLLATAQEIEKLRIVTGGGDISLEQVMANVTAQTRCTAFQAIDSALEGDAARLLRLVTQFNADDQSGHLLLWQTIKELRRLLSLASACKQGQSLQQVMREQRLWESQQRRISGALRRLGWQQLQTLYTQASQIDLRRKGLRHQGNAWQALIQVLVAMAGAKLALNVDYLHE